MQSRTSFFNGTLLRKNLTRFWPLWGMASFVGALFPLALVMELLRNRHFELTQIDLAGAYYRSMPCCAPWRFGTTYTAPAA